MPLEIITEIQHIIKRKQSMREKDIVTITASLHLFIQDSINEVNSIPVVTPDPLTMQARTKLLQQALMITDSRSTPDTVS